jgi:hypothetical protein
MNRSDALKLVTSLLEPLIGRDNFQKESPEFHKYVLQSQEFLDQFLGVVRSKLLKSSSNLSSYDSEVEPIDVEPKIPVDNPWNAQDCAQLYRVINALQKTAIDECPSIV